MVTKSPIEICKVGRTLIAYECIHEPQPDDEERRKKAIQIVWNIKPAVKDAVEGMNT